MAEEHALLPFFLLLCWTPGQASPLRVAGGLAMSTAGLPNRLTRVRNGDWLKPLACSSFPRLEPA